MAKNQLIGGALWENYSRKVAQRMNHPRYQGELTEDDAKRLGGRLIVADWGAESCGDAVRLYWIVDPVTHTILDARFKSFGCGTAIASSDMMAELCIGKTVDEAVTITNLDVEKALRDDPDTPAVPSQKMHCSVMAYDVIKQAVAIYKGVDRDSLEKEEIVCECARVSLRTLQEVIRLNNLTTVEQITQYTKAGAFCKSCIQPGGHEKRKYYLVDILRQVREDMAKEKRMTEETRFSDMTIVQKHKILEKILEDEIRPMLAADGGNLEIVDIQNGENGKTLVYIRYLGACHGCASAMTGTLYAIQGYLNRKVDENIVVYPI
ncbi:MAG: iron-sulfur cluster assembly scaffold protein [Brevinematales bacterium]|nr:iron-sulfur cluster assembly scaffold protein [Brevinematales bacterium]